MSGPSPPRLVVDQRADIDLLVERVTRPELPDQLDETFDEEIVNRLVREDALGGDTDLARVAEAPDDESSCPVKIGVRLDQDRRIRHQARVSCAFAGGRA